MQCEWLRGNLEVRIAQICFVLQVGRVRMLSPLITQYCQISKKIELALAADDSNLVSELDTNLLQIWDQLIQFETLNINDRRMLAEFLIDQLIELESTSANTQRIKEKILSMFNPH